MQLIKKGLGKLERQLFAYMQMRGETILRTGDLINTLKITPKQERELLSRLNRSGMIARVQRGLYLVPSRIPLGGRWTPDEVLALNTLMRELKGLYQICGPNAFNRYGFDEQIPTRVFAYNNRISGDRQIGSVTLTLIKVSDERLGGVEEVRTPEGEIAVFSSRPRTLLDAVYDWARFNTLPRAYSWMKTELRSKRVRPAELVEMALRYGDVGAIRRIGSFLESLGVRSSLLVKLQDTLRSTDSFIPLVPNRPKRGKISRKWGVVENAGW